MLKRMLIGFGFDVDMADDGVEAVSSCKRNRYDLIVMDYLMPRMSGVEAHDFTILFASSEFRPWPKSESQGHLTSLRL